MLSNGVIATGSIDAPTLTSFRADSFYFYETEQIKLVITDIEWLKKDMEKVLCIPMYRLHKSLSSSPYNKDDYLVVLTP